MAGLQLILPGMLNFQVNRPIISRVKACEHGWAAADITRDVELSGKPAQYPKVMSAPCKKTTTKHTALCVRARSCSLALRVLNHTEIQRPQNQRIQNNKYVVILFTVAHKC